MAKPATFGSESMLLAADVEVSPETIAAFQTDGHAVGRGLASAQELAEVGPIIERLGVEHAYDKRPMEERDTYGKAFLQSFNLWRVDAVVADFVRSPRFARVATELSTAQEFDRKVWLGGREPGELVDHELNPRLWPVP